MGGLPGRKSPNLTDHSAADRVSTRGCIPGPKSGRGDHVAARLYIGELYTDPGFSLFPTETVASSPPCIVVANTLAEIGRTHSTNRKEYKCIYAYICARKP
jgi:hypothetical protein